MGLWDKTKTAVKNADNRMGQSVDSAKYDSKISDQKNAKKKAIEEAGQKMFEAYCEGKCELTAEVKELYDKAKACDEEIAKLEKEKADMISGNEAARQANRDALAEKEEADRKAAEEKKAAEAAAKAEAEEKKE